MKESTKDVRPAQSQNAVKPDSEKKLSYIQMRVMTVQKAKWVKQAQKQGLTLTNWMTQKLNS